MTGDKEGSCGVSVGKEEEGHAPEQGISPAKMAKRKRGQGTNEQREGREEK